MSNKNSSHADSIPVPDWQILGEIELLSGMGADDTIHLWLRKLLEPLGLHSDFLGKVLESAQDAAGRAMRSERVAKLGHLHLLVYAPNHAASPGQTWGFFQIKKMRDPTEDRKRYDHTIEFYLYLEG